MGGSTAAALLRAPKLTQLLQTDSEFNETKFVGKIATRANTILIEKNIRRKLERAHKKMVRTLPRIRPVKPPTLKMQYNKLVNSVFDELKLVKKMTISSKTHKEKNQTRTNKDDARMQWFELSMNDTIKLLIESPP